MDLVWLICHSLQLSYWSPSQNQPKKSGKNGRTTLQTFILGSELYPSIDSATAFFNNLQHSCSLNDSYQDLLECLVYGDDDHYCTNNKIAEEAEMACAGRSTHYIVSHKVEVAVLSGLNLEGACSSDEFL